MTLYGDHRSAPEKSRSRVVGSSPSTQVPVGWGFGIVNRIVMTPACLALLWSVVTAAVMHGKRRRPGSAGLPRRPADLRLANRLALIAVLLGLIYPLWGVSALVVLAFDRFVIRRWGRARRAFGQRERAPAT